MDRYRFCPDLSHQSPCSKHKSSCPSLIIPSNSEGGFLSGSVVKNLPANAGDSGLIHGSGGYPGKGNGYPLQYSCLGNPWTEEPDRLQSMGLQKSQIRLSN